MAWQSPGTTATTREMERTMYRDARLTSRIIEDADGDLWLEFKQDNWICITAPEYLQRLYDKMTQDRWSRHSVTEYYGPTHDLLLVHVGMPQVHEGATTP
jgi:hypothetical protein